jgi:hypothetical protein
LKALSNAKYCSKSWSLYASFKVADECSVQASSLLQLGLRYFEFILANSAHYLPKGLFHSETRLNLLPTLDHIREVSCWYVGNRPRANYRQFVAILNLGEAGGVDT